MERLESRRILIEAVPHQNFPGGHSQKLRQHHTRASVSCLGAKREPRHGGDAGAQSGRPWMGGSYPAALITRTASGDRSSTSYDRDPAAITPPAAPPYLCSLGTNTLLGNSTNGLFARLFDGGAVN